MSLVDIRAMILELNSKIATYRLANFYDLVQTKGFLLKFSKTESEKIFVVVESGMRLHTTKFERDKNQLPSSFTAKIRKYIRTRRLEKVQQLGIDRIVEFTFGKEDENTYRLICEFYAKGNITLTDKNYKILAILRPHGLEEGVKYAIGETYPLDSRRQIDRLTEEKLEEILKTVEEPKTQLKNFLNSQLYHGPNFAVHCIVSSGLKPNIKVSEIKKEDIKNLVKYFNEADDFLEKIETEKQKGYIICKEGTEKDLEKVDNNLEEKRKLYEEFHPYLFVQYKNRPIVEFDSFDTCMDEFFAVDEVSRVNEQKKNLKQTALKKVDKIKKEQEERINRLQNEEELSKKKAELIQYNADIVDEAIEIISSARKQGISWEEIKNVIKEQKEDENPVAEIIHSLQLEKSKITLLLKNPMDDDDDDDDEESEPIKVQVDITLSAFGNVKQYFDDKKKSGMKKSKTIEHSDKVITLAEEKAMKSLKQQTTKQVKNIQQMRKRFWFEKFNWFITSENYLILSGRDAQQNDILIKRYMKKGDIYVHADVHGASSCIIKNPSGKAIPKATLIETGVMTVCRSSAWNAKIISDAWWVYDYQVSKTAPSGEYLPTGSFMIRGKKNFLTPSQPQMALALLFKLSDDSIAKHLNERKVEINEDEIIDKESFIEIVETELKIDEKAEVFHKSGELEFVNLQKKQQQQQKKEEKVQERKLTPKDKKNIKELQKKGFTEKEATEKILKNDIPKDEEIEEKNKQKPIPRGKKAKLKKMKKKYGDQDEEERKIKMKLLGHKIEEEQEDEEDEEEEESGVDVSTNGTNEPKLEEKIEIKKEEIIQKQKESEEVSKLMVEENISFLNSEVSIIDSLTGIPNEDDEILYAIPVCAPYIAVKNYKYKVKLLPGNLTRGKASKLIQSQFVYDAKQNSEKEMTFIKQIPDEM
eukprot:gene6002-10000_t